MDDALEGQDHGLAHMRHILSWFGTLVLMVIVSLLCVLTFSPSARVQYYGWKVRNERGRDASYASPFTYYGGGWMSVFDRAHCLNEGMTLDEVTALIGPPDGQYAGDDELSWYFFESSVGAPGNMLTITLDPYGKVKFTNFSSGGG